MNDPIVTVLESARSALSLIGANQHDVEDVSQDVALRFMRYGSSVNPGKLAAWTARAARNAYYDSLRYGRAPLPEPVGLLEDVVCRESLGALDRRLDPQLELALEQLEAALDELGEDRRRALNYDGCKVQRFRARRHLRRILLRRCAHFNKPRRTR